VPRRRRDQPGPAPAGERRAVDLRFRDLGTLVVERDGAPLPLGGPRLTAALALLLIHAGHRVGVDALTGAMWGQDASSRAPSTLESHVWRLRKVLEPARGRGEPSAVLPHDVDGYRLLATTDQVDSLRFARLAGEAVHLLADNRAERALRYTDEALSLWRGRPYTPVADQAWAEAAVARLEELHAQVRERHVDALLAVGGTERALVELESTLREQPLRERSWAQRMLACHRLGRTDQALRTYQDARRLFLDEVGVEPGAELRELQARILADDSALAGPRAAVPGARVRPPAGATPRVAETPGAREAPRADEAPRAEDTPEAPAAWPPVPPAEVHLPGRATRLIGRADELAALTAALGGHRLVTVVGAAGCGKTRLAVEVARAAAADYPDGVWFVDLTAACDGDRLLDTVIATFGPSAGSAGAAGSAASAGAALSAVTRDRRMLLLLDNCEHVLDAVAGLVDHLLVAGSGLDVLATSREPLEVAGELVRPLPPLALPAADTRDVRHSPAVELLLERLASAEPAAAVDAVRLSLAVRIARAVDGVPLALELAAARARAFSLDEIADQVTADPSSLSSIGRGRPDHHRTVRFAIEQSYRALAAGEAALHRQVSVIPGPFTVSAAAALGDVPTEETGDRLARLVHRSLLVPLGPTGPGRPSRFAQLATVRGHAAHTASASADGLLVRRDRWVARLVAGRPRLGRPEEAGWFAALDDDLAGLRATLHRTLVDRPCPAGVAVASRLGMYWYFRGMAVEGRQWMEQAVALGDRSDPLDRALAELALARYLYSSMRADLARPHLAAGLAAARGTDTEHSTELAEGLAVLVHALWLAGEVDATRTADAVIADTAARTGDPVLHLFVEMSELTAGVAATRPGSRGPGTVAATAAGIYRRALELDNIYAALVASGSAALAAVGTGEVAEGMRWTDRMVAHHLALGIGQSPFVFEVRATLLTMSGDPRQAVRLFAAARTHHRRAGMRWPRRESTADRLRLAGGMLDRVEAEQAWLEGTRLTLTDLVAGPDVPGRGLGEELAGRDPAAGVPVA
jgi:predicted ATPase